MTSLFPLVLNKGNKYFSLSLVHFQNSLMSYPNYLWVNLQTPVNCGTTPNFVIGAFRECDCFDILTLALTFAQNTSLATITLSVNWFDNNGVALFSESYTSALTSASFLKTLQVKGANCSITINGAVNGAFTVQGTAILGVYRG